MKRARQMVTVAAIAALSILPAAVPATASPVQAMVGPECQPGVGTAVLDRLGELNVPLTSGQQIQYLEVFRTTAGTYAIRPCVVTVPA